MTPSAVTPAARRARAVGQPATEQPPARRATEASPGRAAAAARTSGHPGSVRRPSAPWAPRRVSGPISGLVGDHVITPPQRGGRAAPRRAWRTVGHDPLPARAVAYVRALPDHSLLDRIIRGRAWIPLLGVLLAGIVAMQVEVLKLGANIGRSIERGTALESRNEILRDSVAQLGDDTRIEQLAAGMGMVMPAPAQVKFLAARGGSDVQQAINNIHAPDATAFTAQLQADDLASGLTDSATTPTTTGGSVVQGTPATPVAAAAPTAGQTGSNGGAASPTEG
jgi:hypothetical protein